MDAEFTCAQCGGTFNKGRSDEEARAEAKDLFGDMEDMVVVCDVCWREIMGMDPRVVEQGAGHGCKGDEG